LAELESCFQNERDTYVLVIMSDILKCLLDDPNFIGKKGFKKKKIIIFKKNENKNAKFKLFKLMF